MLEDPVSRGLRPLRHMRGLIGNCLLASVRSEGSLLLKVERVFLNSLKFVRFCRSIFELSFDVELKLLKLILDFVLIVQIVVFLLTVKSFGLKLRRN